MSCKEEKKRIGVSVPIGEKQTYVPEIQTEARLTNGPMEGEPMHCILFRWQSFIIHVTTKYRRVRARPLPETTETLTVTCRTNFSGAGSTTRGDSFRNFKVVSLPRRIPTRTIEGSLLQELGGCCFTASSPRLRQHLEGGSLEWRSSQSHAG